ncbi:MAG: hypothetical protein RRY40_05530 [Oscillospiraceae bacterium]
MKKNSKNAYNQEPKNSYSSKGEGNTESLGMSKDEKSKDAQGESCRSFMPPYGSSQKSENKK